MLALTTVAIYVVDMPFTLLTTFDVRRATRPPSRGAAERRAHLCNKARLQPASCMTAHDSSCLP